MPRGRAPDGGRGGDAERHAQALGAGHPRAVLDRALVHLPTGPQAHVYVALVGADRVSVRLSPAVPDAPPPWQAREQGAVWEALTWQLDGLAGSRAGPVGDAADPAGGAGGPDGDITRLAGVGTTGGGWTAVNLGRAPGLIAFAGDPGASARAVAAVLDEVGLSPAAASVAITVVAPLPSSRVRPDRVRVTTTVRDVLGGSPSSRGSANGTGGLPAEGASHPAGSLRRHLVVVSAPVSAVDQERLGALAAESDNTAAVVVVGEAPHAAWRFEVDDAGGLDVRVLGLRRPSRRFADRR